MIVDHQGNIRCSEFEISVPHAAGLRAMQVGPTIHGSFRQLLREEFGLDVDFETMSRRVEVDRYDLTFRSNWKLPTRS